MGIKVVTEEGEWVVSGALGADGASRIVKINDYDVNIEPDEHILLTPHVNKPGMVAAVATVLGNKGININMMQVARKGKEAKGESLMIMNTDVSVDDAVLNEIKKVDGILGASFVSLK